MATEKIIHFEKGRDDGLVGRLESGKVVLLRKSNSSAKIQIGEAWECIIEEKDRFCLATPVARQEEKNLFARQGLLFWQIRSGRVALREEEISEYGFISKPRKFYIAREMYAVVEGAEYQLNDRDTKELSGNESFQKVMAEKTAIEEAERAEAEVCQAREKTERLLTRFTESGDSFRTIGLALKESGEYVFSGSVSLRVETLCEECFIAVAFDGRELEVSRKGKYCYSGFTFKDDSDLMEWHTNATTIKLGKTVSIENLTTLVGFDDFLFETVEANAKRLMAEKLAKKLAEGEVAQASAVGIKTYKRWQGKGSDTHELQCLCGMNHSDFVYGTVDAEDKQIRVWMCDNCLTSKAKTIIEAKALAKAEVEASRSRVGALCFHSESGRLEKGVVECSQQSSLKPRRASSLDS